jgi:hypothetical protein
MKKNTPWILGVFIGLSAVVMVPSFIKAVPMLEVDGEENSKIALTPLQLTINKLMKMWTLLDMIQALQNIPSEHIMLFARELVEGSVYVYGMLDLLLQKSEFSNDTDSLVYLYDLIEHINGVQVDIFETVKLDEIACVRVMIQLIQKKLLLRLAHQQ